MEWYSDLGDTLIFERDGVHLILLAYPGSGIDEQELIKIAESMRPYLEKE